MSNSKYWLLMLQAVLALPFATLIPTGAQSNATQWETAKVQNAVPAGSLSGTWAISTPRGQAWYNYALIGDEPPMTPWAEAKFKANKPSFGPNPQEESNDPAYSCLPNTVPRVYPAVQPPMQTVALPPRLLLSFAR